MVCDKVPAPKAKESGSGDYSPPLPRSRAAHAPVLLPHTLKGICMRHPTLLLSGASMTERVATVTAFTDPRLLSSSDVTLG